MIPVTIKLSQLPQFQGDSSGSYIVINDAPNTATYIVNKESFFTASLFGTASYASSAGTASYVSANLISGDLSRIASGSATASISPGLFNINTNTNVQGDLTASNALFSGAITAQRLVVQTITSSVTYSSGSNTFGNQLTDVQQMTGSLRVTGSGNHWIVGGNVGIGTSNPNWKLQVFGGEAFFNSGIRAGSITDNGISNGVLINGSGVTSAALVAFSRDGGNIFRARNSSSIDVLTVNNIGNVLIGTTTDSGFKLDVNGTARIQDNITFSKTDQRLIFTGTLGQGGLMSSGTNTLRISGGGSGNSSNYTSIALYNLGDITSGNITATSGTINLVQISANGSGQQLAMSSGNLTYNALLIATGLNITGTYSGIVRGLYYNPLVTSVTGVTHRAIETVSGNVVFNSTSGNTLIGTTTDAGFKLDVNGTARVLGSDNATRLTITQQHATATTLQLNSSNSYGGNVLNISQGTSTNGILITASSGNLTANYNAAMLNLSAAYQHNGTGGLGKGVVLSVSSTSTSAQELVGQEISATSNASGTTSIGLRIASNSTSGNPIALTTTTGNVLFNTTSGDTAIGSTLTSGYKLLVSGSSTSGSLNVNNTLYVSGSSVGIGTNSPVLPLDVLGSGFGVRPTGSGYPINILASDLSARFYAVHTSGDWGFNITRASDDAGAANLTLFHTRNSDASIRTPLQNGDFIGRINFQGVSGTSAGQTIQTAQILAVVSGSVTAGSMPTDLLFNVSSSGAEGLVGERIRIKGSSGNILINTTTDAGFKLDVNGTARVQGNLTTNLTSGSVPFIGASGLVTQDTSNLVWDNTNKRLGIGTNSLTGTTKLRILTDATNDNLWMDRFAGVPNFIFRRANGTESSPTAILNNDILGAVGFRGYNGSAFTTFSSTVLISYATENWNTGANGSDLRFETTATGGTTRTEKMRIFSGGNVLIQNGGTFTDSGQRLQVTGDTLLKGSGNTSATTALTVQNSDGNVLLRVRNDGLLSFRTDDLTAIYPTTDGFSPAINGNSIRFQSNLLSTARYGYSFVNSNANLNWTTSTGGMIYLTGGYNPTSGTGQYRWITLEGTINQTGGANGVTRGLYVNPTLTSAADWRSIEWSNNASAVGSGSWGLYGAGTAPNYLRGNLGINTLAPSASLHISGSTGVLLEVDSNTQNNILFVSASGNVGIATTGSSAFTLDVNGTARVTSLTETSTIRLKQNITPYTTDLDKFKQLQPVAFEWKETGKADVGLIAEEVDALFPEFVSRESTGEISGVHYSKLATLFINVIKAQEARISALEAQIKKITE